jgi:hypothetical protein
MEKTLNEVLEHLREVGWTEDSLTERQKKFEHRHEKTGQITEYNRVITPKGREHLARVRNSITQPTVNSLAEKPPKIKYEVARIVFWQIMNEKLKREGKQFSGEGSVREVIPQLIRYFIGDSSGELPLNKGIYLWGDTGSGKTFLFEILQEMLKQLGLQRQSFKIFNTCDIVEKVTLATDFDASFYVSNTAVFDDFGIEDPIVKVFGVDKKPLMQIVPHAYTKYKNSQQMTHFSGMLPPVALLKKESKGINQIDRRVYERICEMTTLVKLSGKSKRGIS